MVVRGARLLGEEIRLVVTARWAARVITCCFAQCGRAAACKGEGTGFRWRQCAQLCHGWRTGNERAPANAAFGSRRGVPHCRDGDWRRHIQAPSIVAGNTASPAEFLGAWLLGGVISLCGHWSTPSCRHRHPETGGEYTFLQHAFGRGAAFLFAWVAHDRNPDRCHRRGRFRIGEYASEIIDWAI